MRRNLKKELIAVVRINNDFVTYIVNACGKRGYVLTHVFMFCFYPIVVMLSRTVMIQVIIMTLMRTQKSGDLLCEHLQQITVLIFFQSEKLICNFHSRNKV